MNPVRYPKSPKGGSKQEFLHLALPLISLLQVIVPLQIWYVGEHTKSQPEMGMVTLRDPF